MSKMWSCTKNNWCGFAVGGLPWRVNQGDHPNPCAASGANSSSPARNRAGKFESRRAAKDWSSTHYPDSPTKEVGRGASEWAIRPPPSPGSLSRGAHQTGLSSRTPRRLRGGVRLKRIGGNDRQSVCEARTQQRSAILLYFNRQPCPSSRHVEQKVSHSYVRCHGHLPTLSGTVSTYV